MRRTSSRLLLFAALALPAVAAAQNPGSDTAWPKRAQDKTVITSDSFLSAHPDIKYRLSGLEWYKQGNWARAHEDFRRAARYGDKPAQGMLGEMHWNGHGVDVDRAIAYAWMDIAAERAYPLLIAKRERYWNDLTPAERERAVEVGDGMYAEFGDPAAKPRLERLLRQARRSVTGSRVGSVGALTIHIPTPGGTRQVDGAAFWDEKYWDPKLYWRWQDDDWKAPAEGEVTVGDVLTDTAEPTPDP